MNIWVKSGIFKIWQIIASSRKCSSVASDAMGSSVIIISCLCLWTLGVRGNSQLPSSSIAVIGDFRVQTLSPTLVVPHICIKSRRHIVFTLLILERFASKKRARSVGKIARFVKMQILHSTNTRYLSEVHAHRYNMSAYCNTFSNHNVDLHGSRSL